MYCNVTLSKAAYDRLQQAKLLTGRTAGELISDAILATYVPKSAVSPLLVQQITAMAVAIAQSVVSQEAPKIP